MNEVYFGNQIRGLLAVCHRGKTPLFQTHFMNMFADPEATYRYDPTADIFIQSEFGPNQDKHIAIPEGLHLWKQHSITF